MDKETVDMNDKKQRERSTAYPSADLEEAIELTKKLRENRGPGPHKRSAAAVGIGYSGVSGTSAAKIAAMTHFGLLDRAGDTYTVSDLAKRILFFQSEEEKMSAIIEAAKQPYLYSVLLEKFAGEKLPTMLHNILHTNYGISMNAASSASNIFTKSMRFAKLLDENDVLVGSNPVYVDTLEQRKATAPFNSSAQLQSNASSETTAAKYRVADGKGWRLTLESDFTLNKEIRIALVELEEALENLSDQNNEEK